MIAIGIAGPPGAGKRTVAAWLEQRHGFAPWSFGPVITRFEHLRDQLAHGCLRHLEAMGVPGAVCEVVDNEEAGFIRARGGQIWLVQRPGFLTRAGSHYKGLCPMDGDRGIFNDGGRDELRARVDFLVAALTAAAGA